MKRFRIIDVPIEPIEERYSIQWKKWFHEYYRKNGIDFLSIEGLISDQRITQGEFLDVIFTHIYKSSQIQNICSMIERGEIRDTDILFFHDLWFPGLESLFYIRDALNIKFKIAGCLHAGTYDPWDYLTRRGMSRWGRKLEECWLNEVDIVFVATHFHKSLLCSNRTLDERKIKVTGFPIYWDRIEVKEKKPIVLFPHRIAPEKDPGLFKKLAEDADLNQRFVFLYTKAAAKSKEDYYCLLESATFAISFAKQETWGIAMQESVLAGCVPFVPGRLSYSEMYPEQFIYHDMADLKHKLLSLDKLDTTFLKQRITEKGKQAIENMMGYFSYEKN